ncbi:Ger(x)C family spore germination protein [Paenibacillus marchantiae]|uniref:Ger(x)C family spore germination protein n=1 Tax=Paenibacillus marchantiae TaxID=3026433 RepID=UPI00237C1711|nr:Ger(x)C family spore germination protein [Paenibacillus marchantiae]WDQ34579.1 Ger(x)C family spore germination protein [Paenibacillus marchantiae]
MKRLIQRWLLGLLSLSLCFVTSGCWSAYEIQQVDYAKAIGIDYKDGLYHMYVQSMDFTSVAKSESSTKTAEAPPVWVGHASGKTLNLAVNELFRSSQLHIAWGHVTAIVMAESILTSKHIKEVFDMLGRFPESRYTTWVYGTRDPLENILSATSIYNLSPLDSILHNPLPSFLEESLFPPVLSFKLIATHNNASTTTYLPCITLNKEHWSQNKKNYELFMIDGAFFERTGDDFEYLPHSKLPGFHWLLKDMRRAPLIIENEGTIYGALSVGLPNVKIVPVIRGNEVHFNIDAKYLTALYEYLSPVSYDEMVRFSEKTLREQILQTYREGLKRGVDVYGLQEKVYRKNPSLWRKLSNNGTKMILTEDSIQKLDIHITIPYTGKFRRKV